MVVGPAQVSYATGKRTVEETAELNATIADLQQQLTAASEQFAFVSQQVRAPPRAPCAACSGGPGDVCMLRMRERASVRVTVCACFRCVCALV